MRILLKKLHYLRTVCALSILAVGGCMSLPNPKGKPAPIQTFAHIAPVYVDALSVDIVDPENNFLIMGSIPYGAMAKNYFYNKVKPQGVDNTVRIVLEELKFTASDNGGFAGLGGHNIFRPEMSIAFQRLDNRGVMTHAKKVKLARTIHVSKHASIAARENKIQDGLDALFRTLDLNIEPIMRNDLKL